MPCTYDETPDEIRQAERKRLARRKTELNKVTRLLCKVMTALADAQEDENCTTSEDVFQIVANIPSVQAWWADHQKRDADKLKKIVKERAMNKLSKAEQKALGLI